MTKTNDTVKIDWTRIDQPNYRDALELVAPGLDLCSALAEHEAEIQRERYSTTVECLMETKDVIAATLQRHVSAWLDESANVANVADLATVAKAIRLQLKIEATEEGNLLSTIELKLRGSRAASSNGKHGSVADVLAAYAASNGGKYTAGTGSNQREMARFLVKNGKASPVVPSEADASHDFKHSEAVREAFPGIELPE